MNKALLTTTLVATCTSLNLKMPRPGEEVGEIIYLHVNQVTDKTTGEEVKVNHALPVQKDYWEDFNALLPDRDWVGTDDEFIFGMDGGISTKSISDVCKSNDNKWGC